MGKAFYEIKELNVDGCGSDAVVYISSEKELTQNQSDVYLFRQKLHDFRLTQIGTRHKLFCVDIQCCLFAIFHVIF